MDGSPDPVGRMWVIVLLLWREPSRPMPGGADSES